MAYGDDIAAYSTVASVMLTLYRQTLGDFDVSSMERCVSPNMHVSAPERIVSVYLVIDDSG